MSRKLEKRFYDEISLPFEHIDADYIRGMDLHSAIASKPVEEALEEHSVRSIFNGSFNDYVIRDDDFMGKILAGFNSGVSMEIEPTDHYSHFAAELIPSIAQPAEELSRELKNLEKGLEQYFMSVDPTAEYRPLSSQSDTPKWMEDVTQSY